MHCKYCIISNKSGGFVTAHDSSLTSTRRRVQTKCPRGQKKCRNSSKCIKMRQFCDGIKDCDDGSDEAAYICSKST